MILCRRQQQQLLLLCVSLLLTVTATAAANNQQLDLAGEVVGTVSVNYEQVTIVGDVLNTTSIDDNSTRVLHRFRSVPYARPPTGDRRFLKPQAYDFSQTATVNATVQAPRCPQNEDIGYSEDCLFMNIWTPNATHNGQYPVFVYIHGGQFEEGGIPNTENQGDVLVRYHDMVVVTINYRLGALGFLYLDDGKLPGNYGLLDQRMALQVIRSMIANFGGDPNRITLAGHGTGAASVGFHIATESISVSRAVLMGGSPLMPLTWSNDFTEVRKISEQFVNVQLDCARGALDDVIKCLQNKTVQEIVKNQADIERILSTLEFLPVLDQDFFHLRDPLLEWVEKKGNVTLMVGVTADSGSEFVDYSLSRRNLTIDALNRSVYYEILDQQFEYYPRFPTILDDTGKKYLQLSLTEWNDNSSPELLRDKWSQAFGDYNFLCPTIQSIVPDNLPQLGDNLNSYVYYFTAPEPNNDKELPAHTNDVRYFFGAPAGVGVPYPSGHRELSLRMMQDLANFVQGDVPNPNWNQVIAGDWNYNAYNLGSATELYNLTGGFGFDRCYWWRRMLPYVNGLESGSTAQAGSALSNAKFGSQVTAMDTNLVKQKASLADALPQLNAQLIGDVTVQIGTGSVTGESFNISTGEVYNRFLGIPYAMPPTGSRRFARPQARTIDSAIQAKTPPNACPQIGNISMSEDCLYLNVWAPANRPGVTRMPVFVYIHGGFFESGSSVDPMRSGDTLAAHRDVVVVTFNYRLAALGFLRFQTSGSRGNYGLWDQDMAIQWVNNNIALFGGDSNNITLVGDGVGAVSIGYHMLRNTAQFNTAIMMSGSPAQAFPLTDNFDAVLTKTEQYLAKFNCSSGSAGDKLACMRNQSVEDLVNNFDKDFVNQLGPEALVTIDGDFLDEDPWLSMQQGKLRKIPVIFGQVDKPAEAIVQRHIKYGLVDLQKLNASYMTETLAAVSSYNPRFPPRLNSSGQELIAMQFYPIAREHITQTVIDYFVDGLSDGFYTCSGNEFLIRLMQGRIQSDAFVYNYLFTEQSIVNRISSLGAGLGEDSIYLFGAPLTGSGYSEAQRNLSSQMIDLFLHFAATGNPNGPSQSWYEYTTNLKPYLLLDADTGVASYNYGVRINECGFWQHTLPYVNNLYARTITPDPGTTRPPVGPQGEIIGEVEVEIDLSVAKTPKNNPRALVGDLVRLPNGKNITRYLGVPYATNTSRYAVSQMVTQISGQAKTMPPACPQRPDPNRPLTMSEDCLYINIWAPVRSAVLHPVAVFFHGGNYTSGANSFDEFRGEQLLESEDVVFVSVNYRLGNLGFLYLDDEKLAGNFGLLDQRLALSLINRIIGSFGGDNNQITIMGHGTDAASVGFHSVTDSAGHFAKVVMMGGSPSMPLAWSSDKNEVRELSEEYVNNQLDCARGALDDVIQCLREKPLDDIMREQFNLQGSRDHIVFMPVFNRAFFNNQDPYQKWKNGSMDKPLVIGVGSDSGRYYTEQSLARRNISWESLNRTLYENILDLQFRYYPRFPDEMRPSGAQFLKYSLTDWNYLDYNRRIKALWSQAMGDFNFLCPVWEATSDLLKAKESPVYVYYIDAEDPLRVQDDLQGADHWADMLYLLGEPFRKNGYPVSHQNLSRTMMRDLTSFLRGDAVTRWRQTNLTESEFMYYDVLATSVEGPSIMFAEMVPGGFGLNNGRCPVWKNELPYINTLIESGGGPRNKVEQQPRDLSRVASAVGKLPKQQQHRATDLDTVIGDFDVTIPNFGVVKGQTIETHHNRSRMSEFLGIPFAKPPVGQLRFAKPEKPDFTSATQHDARKLPALCYQREYLKLPMEEDCLYLNIWTPMHSGNTPSNLPVLVFVHGGFFEVGGSQEPQWIGSKIVDYHDAVVVTFNYRLGAFGFLTLDDTTTRGNYGLFDQEMALQWVQDNIGYFGGDKDKVTAMGVDAGSVSIGYHLARPNQNHFDNVIMMTGSPYMSYPLTNDINFVRETHRRFARSVNCTDANTLLQCLRSVSDKAINDAQSLYQQLFQGIEFPPVVDGEFITLDPWELDPSQLRQVPMIFGGVDRPANYLIQRIAGSAILTPENFTHDEFLNTLEYMNNYFPRFPLQMTESGRTGLRLHFQQYNAIGNFQNDLRDLSLALSDSFFTCANNRFIDAYSNASQQPVYHYLFGEGKDDVDPGLPLERAGLFEDAYYALGNPTAPGRPHPNKQTQLSRTMMSLFFNFMENGNPNRPNAPNLSWEPYEQWNRSYIALDADLLPPPAIADGFRMQECGYWDTTLPYVNSLRKPDPPTSPPSTRPPIGPEGEVVDRVDVQVNNVLVIGDRVTVPDRSKNITRFLGLPYAAPPVGNLRFAPPAALNTTGINFYYANRTPPACPQDNSTLNIPYSEDCLYMNIWSPDVGTDKKYPVVVYFHGGSLEQGAISELQYRGETMLSQESVVLVTVGYRLGAFGFLYLDDDKMSGNFGLLDQRMALAAVNQVISLFGGDPDRITIAGHDLGAAAVGFHSVTESKKFFKQSVMMGGSPTMPLAWYDGPNGKDRVRAVNEEFVNVQVDCSRGSLDATIQCLRELSADLIVERQKPFLKILNTIEFMPVLDKHFFAGKDPLVAWRNQEAFDIVSLMGVTSEPGAEFAQRTISTLNISWAQISDPQYTKILDDTFLYYPRFPTELDDTGREFLRLSLKDYVDQPDKLSTRTILSQGFGDRNYMCPVWDSIVQKGSNKTNTNVFMYLFTARDPLDNSGSKVGAEHETDLRYFFGYPLISQSNYPSVHVDLSRRMMRDLVEFANSGRPNVNWQQTDIGTWDYADYDTGSDRYNLTEGTKTIQRCGMWFYDLPFANSLIPDTGSSSSSSSSSRQKRSLSKNEKLPDLFACCCCCCCCRCDCVQCM